ncbi:MAG TPA: methyltransferase domain-containing protein [Solirubrobacteraceae bacterium]|nr:methyltransferase domain-containing protein [Solirubrobacteraceae bacterium]
MLKDEALAVRDLELPAGSVEEAAEFFEHGWRSRSATRLPAFAVQHLRVPVTMGLRPLARLMIRRSLKRAPVRLNLGSGFAPKPGWTNIDLIGARRAIPWNLAKGIPYPDESVDAVFHEHFLEHLPMPVGLALTKECKRVLRRGGVLRFGVPDAEAVIRSYARQINTAWAESKPTAMLAVSALFYEDGHCAMYDSLTMEMLCRAAGFSEVSRAYDGESRIRPCPDGPERFGSAWVEAVA